MNKIQEKTLLLKIESVIDKKIDKKVNGRINELDEKLTARLDAQDLAMKPVIETIIAAKLGKKFAFGLLSFLVTAGGLYLLIRNILHK